MGLHTEKVPWFNFRWNDTLIQHATIIPLPAHQCLLHRVPKRYLSHSSSALSAPPPGRPFIFENTNSHGYSIRAQTSLFEYAVTRL